MSRLERQSSSGLLWGSDWRVLAVAISATNLNLLPLWRILIYADEAESYFLASAGWHDRIAALFLLVILSAALFVLLKAAMRANRLRVWLLLALLGAASVNVLNFARMTAIQFSLAASAANLLCLGLLGVSALMFLLFPQRLLSIFFGFYLVLSPFAAMTTLQALSKAVADPPALTGAVDIPERESDARVVWVIFDELDRRYLFGEHRGESSYPAFDQLRETSVHFSHASPVTGRTITAVPSYWIGERVENSIRLGDSQLGLQVAGSATERPLEDFNHLIKAAWRQGARIGMTGFYHPYCRLFARYVTSCKEYFWGTILPRRTNGVVDSMRLSVAALNPLWRRISLLRIVEDSENAMLEQVGDPELDFVALHLMMPHMPAVYDPESDRLQLLRSGLGYPDNITKADRILAGMVQQMKTSGTWDRTHLIVTSDHGKSGDKTAPGAVPLLIRMAGQAEPVTVDDEVDLRVLRGLILGLLSGELATPMAIEQELRSGN